MSNQNDEQLQDVIEDGYAYFKIIVDADNNPCDFVILEINSSFEKITGITKEKIIGQKITNIFPDIVKSEFNWIDTFGNLALKGGTISFEAYFASLQQYLKVRASSFEQGFFAVLFSDITSRINAQKKHKLMGEISITN